jgi:hypothetical protein
LVLRLQPPPASPPRRVAQCPELLARVGVLVPTRARQADLQTPLVAFTSLPWHPRFGPRRPGPSPRAVHHDSARFEGPRCLPPIGPINRAPRLRSGRCLLGRHWYPGFATKSPASDVLSRPASPTARPKPLPGFHRSVRATRRLPTSATECPPNTPTNRPNPARLPQRRTAARAGGSAPCEAPPTEFFQARGRSGFLGPFDPHHDDRSPQRIYPNLIDSGTPCHDPVSNDA